MDSRDSPWPGFKGGHHLRPYSILYNYPHGLQPNVILSQDSQVKNPKIPKIGTPGTLEGHNFLCEPSIEAMFEAKL
jgi:hypothetical protein